MQNNPYYPYHRGRPIQRSVFKFVYYFLLLVIAGLAGTIQFHTYLVYQTFQQGSCTIESGSVERHQSKSSTNYTPHLWYTVHTKDGQLAEADGYDAPYQTNYDASSDAQQIVNSYTVGTSYDCWYDPASPTHAILVFRGYSISDLIINYLITTIAYLVGLLVLTWIFRSGVYHPYLLMTRGALTQGYVTEHIRKRQKRHYATYSRITFQSQSYPYTQQNFEASGAYPIGSWQPVCYDPYNLKNVKHGGRPIGCGPAFVLLLCIAFILIGLLALLIIWYSI